jgi:D-alanyl-D-alanine carboxypeptidase (penicillin-binding protein 5/6)
VYAYPRRRFPFVLVLGLFLPVVFLFSAGTFQLFRSLPALQPTTEFPASSVLGAAVRPDFPSGGSAVVEVGGLGTIASTGPAPPRPIASITKLMTAYVLMKAHPLRAGETGPTLTLTDADARRYLQFILNDESSLPVSAGMRLTEQQLLQGMLIASAGNFAEILAVWDAGSVSAFVAKMNAEAKSLGMNSTTYADVSGLSPASVSTPDDILLLSRRIMADPVLAGIVATRQTQLPGIGAIRATNDILGQEGVIGIKSGFTDEGGGNLAFAAQRPVGGTDVQVMGAILSQPNRPAVFLATRRLLDSVYANLQFLPVITANQKIATLEPAWGKAVDVVAADEVRFLTWPGMTLEANVELPQIEARLKAGDQVGMLTLRLGEQERRVPLVVAAGVSKPDVIWRLTRS